jgi:hypothetical protein
VEWVFITKNLHTILDVIDIISQWPSLHYMFFFFFFPLSLPFTRWKLPRHIVHINLKCMQASPKCVCSLPNGQPGEKKKKKQAGRQLFFTACNLLDPWVGDLTSSLEGGLQGGPYTALSNLCSGVIVALGWVSDRVGVMSLGKRSYVQIKNQ